jgi:hypothetical protein
MQTASLSLGAKFALSQALKFVALGSGNLNYQKAKGNVRFALRFWRLNPSIAQKEEGLQPAKDALTRRLMKHGGEEIPKRNARQNGRKSWRVLKRVLNAKSLKLLLSFTERSIVVSHVVRNAVVQLNELTLLGIRRVAIGAKLGLRARVEPTQQKTFG